MTHPPSHHFLGLEELEFGSEAGSLSPSPSFEQGALQHDDVRHTHNHHQHHHHHHGDDPMYHHHYQQHPPDQHQSSVAASSHHNHLPAMMAAHPFPPPSMLHHYSHHPSMMPPPSPTYHLTPQDDIPILGLHTYDSGDNDDGVRERQEEVVQQTEEAVVEAATSSSTVAVKEESGKSQVKLCEKEGDMCQLWGHTWKRETSKDGRSMLITTLADEDAYEQFMKHFDVDDGDQGFYWVTDRGRKYSTATSATMQRMRWKDTFNCFFGRRHSKKGADEDCGAGAQDGRRKRNRSSQKLYCPASLSATCAMNGTVELRYFDKHVDHSQMGPPPKRKRAEERGQRRMKLLQNEHLSAWRTVIKPNQPARMHRHDKDRLVYVIKGGRLKVVGENNKVKQVYNLEADKAYWFPRDPPGELHGDVNDGVEPITVLVVEVEDRADLNHHLPTPVVSF